MDSSSLTMARNWSWTRMTASIASWSVGRSPRPVSGDGISDGLVKDAQVQGTLIEILLPAGMQGLGCDHFIIEPGEYDDRHSGRMDYVCKNVSIRGCPAARGRAG